MAYVNIPASTGNISINVPSSQGRINISTASRNDTTNVSLQDVQSFAINKAKDWAEKMDGPIGNEGYSAKWHATNCIASEEKAYGYMQETEKIKNDVLLDSGVQTIYSNIEDVKITAENIDDIITTSDNIEYIKTVLEVVSSSGFITVRDNLDSIIIDANNIDSINTTASNIETIKELVVLKPNIDKVSENLGSIGINASNISDIVTTAENIEDIKDASVLAGELIDIDEIGLGQKVPNQLTKLTSSFEIITSGNTVILKKGSCVPIPVSEDESIDYIVPEDLTLEFTTELVRDYVFLKPDKTLGSSRNIYVIWEDEEEPSIYGYNYWIDSVNKVACCIEENNSVSGCSYPLALVQGNLNKEGLNIKESYDKYGYIDDCFVWINKGISGVIPQGRNADKTENNRTFTTQRLLSSFVNHGGGNAYITISENNIRVINELFEEEITYDASANFNYLSEFTEDGDMIDVAISECICAMLYQDYNVGETVITWSLPYHPISLVEAEELRYKTGLANDLASDAWFEAMGRADTSLSNLDSQGQAKFNAKANKADVLLKTDKTNITSWAMPSSKYINLTLNASGATYTAPANGWVFIDMKTTTNNNRAYGLVNNSTVLRSIVRSHVSGVTLAVFLPVKKGDVFHALYEDPVTANYFRFIYAEGEV